MGSRRTTYRRVEQAYVEANAEKELEPTVRTGEGNVVAVMRITKDRFLTGRNLSHFSELGTYWWTCGLVGVDVVKILGHGEKLGNIRGIGGVEHVHSPL